MFYPRKKQNKITSIDSSSHTSKDTKDGKQASSKRKVTVFQYILWFVLCFGILFISISGPFHNAGVKKAEKQREYLMIDNQYAVIHQDQSQYWVVAVEEKEEGDHLILVLRTSEQMRLNTNGVRLIRKTYDEVQLEEE